MSTAYVVGNYTGGFHGEDHGGTASSGPRTICPWVTCRRMLVTAPAPHAEERISAHCRRHSIAFVIVGDARDPIGAGTSWSYSGAPKAIVEALRELGLAVTPTSTELPHAVQRLVVNVLAVGFTSGVQIVRALGNGPSIRLTVRANKPKILTSREMMWLRSTVVSYRLRATGPFERAIQFGSEYRLPPSADYVTLDDATIVQLRRAYDYPWMRAVSERSLARMIARQRRIFLGARACCLLSHWAARSAIDDYGVPPERVHVVGTGSNHRTPAVSRDWSMPHFLFVGKDFERKRGELVMRAFARVRATQPRATLDVVGEHPAIIAPGVTGHGFLHLHRPEEKRRLGELLARATCLVLPSAVEPTGNVHAEALATGLGSIGTNNGGSSTIIGDAGVTVPPDDEAALVREMLRFSEPMVARQYGERADRRAALFTWEAMAQRLVRALGLPGFDELPLADYL